MKLLTQALDLLVDLTPILLAGCIVWMNLRVQAQAEQSDLLTRGYRQLDERLSVVEELLPRPVDEKEFIPRDSLLFAPPSAKMNDADSTPEGGDCR